MSKRFTDTDKWKKQNFSLLSLKMKLAWIYLCDNCDHAGIWEINLGLMSYQVGEEITLKELIDSFAEKLEIINDNKIIIQSFIDFQYGNLNPNSKVHQSVIKKLEKERVSIGYPKSMDTIKATAKDKDKEKDKEKEKEKETGEIPKDILETIKINYQYSNEVIEEVRKDAWLKYIAIDDPQKNWRRFVANYFKHEKDKIRNMLIAKSKDSEVPNGLDVNELVTRVINSSHLQASEFQKLFTASELELIRRFGSRKIANANEFELKQIKKEMIANYNPGTIKNNSRNEFVQNVGVV